MHIGLVGLGKMGGNMRTRMRNAGLTVVSGLLFLATLVMLHQRDLRAAQARGLLPGSTEA